MVIEPERLIGALGAARALDEPDLGGRDAEERDIALARCRDRRELLLEEADDPADVVGVEEDARLAGSLDALRLPPVGRVLVDCEGDHRVLLDVSGGRGIRSRPDVERHAVVHERERCGVRNPARRCGRQRQRLLLREVREYVRRYSQRGVRGHRSLLRLDGPDGTSWAPAVEIAASCSLVVPERRSTVACVPYSIGIRSSKREPWRCPRARRPVSEEDVTRWSICN